MADYLIKNALIVDGSGAPPVKADLAVCKDRIARVAPDLNEPSAAEIDGTGLVAAPGFIDIHSHTDGVIFKNPTADSKLLQGVTLEVTGNCGLGSFPVCDDRRDLLLGFLKMHDFHLPEKGLTWKDMTGFAAEVESTGIAVNLAPLVAHGALRIAAMGSEDRHPQQSEMQAMKDLLGTMLAQGAWGLSTGLIYPPGSYAATDELAELASVLAAHGRLYTSHIRGEGATLLDAIDEAVRIGRASGARVQVSHLKAMGRVNWGKGRAALDLLENARRAGVDIAADQYPYEATQTTLAVLVPAWAHAGGVSAMLQHLTAEDQRQRLRAEVKAAMDDRGGPDRIRISSVRSERNRALSGQSLQQIAALWNLPPADTVMRLIVEEEAAVSAVFFALSEEDLLQILKSDTVAVGSDGSGLSALDAGAVVHPRSYGAFARVLGHYVRDRGDLPLAEAIYKMTGLPARRLGLQDRGLLRAGFMADIVLFDAERIADTATFENPHSYPRGVRLVMVNGKIAAKDGRPTGERAGRVLRAS